MARLLSDSAHDLPIPHDPLSADEVVAGSPTTGAVTLALLGDVEVGVWEMTPGSATDLEVDEVFVVLSGRGTVTFDDGEAITLRPGVVVRLRAGEATTWLVEETVRKVWVARE